MYVVRHGPREDIGPSVVIMVNSNTIDRVCTAWCTKLEINTFTLAIRTSMKGLQDRDKRHVACRVAIQSELTRLA